VYQQAHQASKVGEGSDESQLGNQSTSRALASSIATSAETETDGEPVLWAFRVNDGTLAPEDPEEPTTVNNPNGSSPDWENQ
jgi:hypothetical protein